MEKPIHQTHMDLMYRGRNVAHRMASVANDVPWAVTYASNLCTILGEVETKLHYRPSIARLARQAHQYLMQEPGTPFFFSIIGKAVSHGLVDDENATRHAISMMKMQPWRKYGNKPCPQVKIELMESKHRDVLSIKQHRGRIKYE